MLSSGTTATAGADTPEASAYHSLLTTHSSEKWPHELRTLGTIGWLSLLPGHFFGLLMSLQDIHVRSLTKASALSGFSVKGAIPPIDVVKILNDARSSFILVGAYGLGGWLQKPRATEDVDVIVAAKHHKKAIKALLAAFPDLEADDLPVVTRLRNRQTHTVAIDVMKPTQQLFRVAFKHTHTLRAGGHVYRVPSLEMALAMKFAPMVSIHRADADKFQDAHDFIYMVQSNPEIDLKKLATLGDLVYPEGAKEIVEKVRQVRAGEKLKL